MGNGDGKRQSVSGNINSTYTTEDSQSDQTPLTDEEGYTATAGDKNRTSIRSSNGYVDPTSTFSALNSGTSLSVPTGSKLVIEANPDNTNPIEIQDPDNNEKVLIQPNKTYTSDKNDVSNIEAKQSSAGDSLQWFFEGDN